MNKDTTPPVLFERVGEHIAVITLNRPAARNAVNAEMAVLIEAYVAQAEGDATIRAGIIAAAGPTFCAGADLKEVAAGRGMELSRPGTGFAGFVHGLRAKPWIAAVQGFAYGGGLEIAMACDMIVAGAHSSFALPEVRRGIIAGASGCIRLARTLPRAVAIELVATGASIDANRAFAMGLINRIVDDASVVDEAIRIAEAIAVNSPLSVRESLGLVRRAVDLDEQELRRLQDEAVTKVLAGPDLIEGASAFVQKRAPNWTS